MSSALDWLRRPHSGHYPLLFLLGLVALLKSPAAADTPQSGPDFVVYNTADTNSGVCGATSCTLREAVNSANAMGGTHIITFDASLAGQVITLSAVDPASTANTPAGTPDNQVTAFGRTALLVTSDITINGLSDNSGVTIQRGGGVALVWYCGGGQPDVALPDLAQWAGTRRRR